MEIPESGVENEQVATVVHPPFILFLLILLAAVLACTLLTAALLFGLGKWQGIDLQELMYSLDQNSSFADRNLIRMVNLAGHVLTFTLPALLTAWFFYQRKAWSALHLNHAPQPANAVWGMVLILVSFPLAQLTYFLNRQLPLPDWATSMEDTTNAMIEGMLVMDGPGELLLNLVLVGVIPAIGEELIFRGLLQQQLQRITVRPGVAVWVTAFIFSAIHFQFEGFIPRMVLGALLGYLFLWSRNLWIPILAHFYFNGFQVLGQYFLADQLGDMDLDTMPSGSWLYGVLSLLATIGLSYHIKKLNESPTT